MNNTKERKTIIYKNDLKFFKKIDTENKTIESDFYDSYNQNDINSINNISFDSDVTENLYNKFKDKNKLELRIKCAHDENYCYFDLSSLHMTDNQLHKLLNLNEIKDILNKIEHIDLSNNKLCLFPDLNEYKNVKSLNISYNNIEGDLIINNYEELCCKSNKITSIISQSLKKIDADDNNLYKINVPIIEILLVNNNKLINIESYKNLIYLECIGNQITEIKNMDNLEELYISNNLLIYMYNFNNLKILNCVENPIEKIHYYPKLEMMAISTNNISKKYAIEDVKKIKNDFFVKLKDN
jgi:hypothetical protein